MEQWTETKYKHYRHQGNKVYLLTPEELNAIWGIRIRDSGSPDIRYGCNDTMLNQMGTIQEIQYAGLEDNGMIKIDGNSWEHRTWLPADVAARDLFFQDIDPESEDQIPVEGEHFDPEERNTVSELLKTGQQMTLISLERWLEEINVAEEAKHIILRDFVKGDKRTLEDFSLIVRDNRRLLINYSSGNYIQSILGYDEDIRNCLVRGFMRPQKDKVIKRIQIADITDPSEYVYLMEDDEGNQFFLKRNWML